MIYSLLETLNMTSYFIYETDSKGVSVALGKKKHFLFWKKQCFWNILCAKHGCWLSLGVIIFQSDFPLLYFIDWLRIFFAHRKLVTAATFAGKSKGIFIRLIATIPPRTVFNQTHFHRNCQLVIIIFICTYTLHVFIFLAYDH